MDGIPLNRYIIIYFSLKLFYLYKHFPELLYAFFPPEELFKLNSMSEVLSRYHTSFYLNKRLYGLHWLIAVCLLA